MIIRKIFFFFTIIFFLSNPLYSSENKILIKIENKIITSIDLEDEKNYLLALNSDIGSLTSDQIYEITKNSIIRNKIKESELIKRNIIIDIDKMFSDQVVRFHVSNLRLKNVNEFTNYMKKFNVNINEAKKKILVEALWNELIIQKYASKIKIDKEQIKKQLIENKGKTKSFELNEILFNVSQNEKLETKYKKIKESIESKGFNNSAIEYSTSDSSKNGGRLGWIGENSINKKILEKILQINVGEYTGPILTPGGFLIIKVIKIKELENEINFDNELKKIIRLKTNNQFQQFSTLYFNKIKREVSINEY